MRNIQLLDCTLRDGGFGLEDAFYKNLSDLKFSLEDIDIVANQISNSNVDIVEIGAVEISKNDKTEFAIYQKIEDISKKIPKTNKKGQMFSALYRGPDTPIENIPKWDKDLITGVRVILRYSELKKSLEFCKSLSEKGYKVFVQPMLTMRYTEDEIQMLIDYSNDMNAYALYFVDSYGYMQKADIERFFYKYNEKLNPNIKIGFHAHNNMNLAFSNAIDFLSIENDSRDIIVDSCITGMGQGAGNLQTEIISDHLNKYFGKNYDYGYILDACDVIEKYCEPVLWGYSVTRLLPAIHQVAYKYSVMLRAKHKFSYREINDILSNMPEELRYRYTEENLLKLLKFNGLSC